MEVSPTTVAPVLHQTFALLVRRLRQHPVPGELSPAEGQALAALVRQEPTTTADLARLEQISAQSMGASIAGLEQRGLVSRHTDPDDGRRVLWRVTPTGQAEATRKRQTRAAQIAEALSTGFTPAELRTLREAAPLLERLAESL